MSLEKYNSRVMQAVRYEYVRTANEKSELQRKLTKITEKLGDTKFMEETQYLEYRGLEQEAECLRKKIEKLKIEHDVWREAREICFNTADE